MKAPQPCRCSGPLVFSDDPEHCTKCGRGPCAPVFARQSVRLRRLPRDLGAFVREGRRPDPHLDNVVRLDRLRRDRWMVPRVPAALEPVPIGAVVTVPDARLTPQQARMLAYFAAGMSHEQVANALGVVRGTVDKTVSDMYARLGITASKGKGGGGAMAAAVAWWRRQHDWEMAA